MEITHASTFSGIGASEVAAEMLGWKNIFHCEINPFCRKVLDYHFPDTESYEDITKTNFGKWRGRITVLSGGFPCQPFSYAGKRRGSQDDRYLWPYMLKCIEQIRPTWFVGENVAGITTMAFPGQDVKVGEQADLFGEGNCINVYEKRERYVLHEIISQLEGIGYSVQPFIIPACAVGAPHRRDRVFIVAHASIGRRGEIHEQIQSEFDHGEEPIGDGGERSFTDTSSKQSNGHRSEQPEISMSEQEQLGRDCGTNAFADTNDSGFQATRSEFKSTMFAGGDLQSLFAENKWRDFPTQSPVYRGNDGIPFDVDGLSIPFSHWKKESLKAYGNAIVPQVMYEIFAGIDFIEKNEKNEQYDIDNRQSRQMQ